MRESINIHVGQAGVKIGEDVWELFCLEHNILPDGSPATGGLTGYDSLLSFFAELNFGNMVPRAVFIDTDPKTMDEFRLGPYSKLFHPDQLISGKEDCSNVFAHGYYGLIDQLCDRIRQQTDVCSGLQGFVIYNSTGGGAGSGLTSRLMERLAMDYGKKTKINFAVTPSETLDNNPVTDPYNHVLNTKFSGEHMDMIFPLDNGAISRICRSKLGIERPGYKNLNRMIAQLIASTTASLRFDGELNANLSEFVTNLVPYPKCHYVISSLAPLIPAKAKGDMGVRQLTDALFDPASMFTNSKTDAGQFMSVCLMYRGDVAPTDVNSALTELNSGEGKRVIKFVDWVSPGFKVGIGHGTNHQVPPGSDLAKPRRSGLLLANSTAYGTEVTKFREKFDLLYRNRTSLHLYTDEGMEEGEFNLAREYLCQLEKDYEDVAASDDDDDDYDDDDDDDWGTSKL